MGTPIDTFHVANECLSEVAHSSSSFIRVLSRQNAFPILFLHHGLPAEFRNTGPRPTASTRAAMLPRMCSGIKTNLPCRFPFALALGKVNRSPPKSSHVKRIASWTRARCRAGIPRGRAAAHSCSSPTALASPQTVRSARAVRLLEVRSRLAGSSE